MSETGPASSTSGGKRIALKQRNAPKTISLKVQQPHVADRNDVHRDLSNASQKIVCRHRDAQPSANDVNPGQRNENEEEGARRSTPSPSFHAHAPSLGIDEGEGDGNVRAIAPRDANNAVDNQDVDATDSNRETPGTRIKQMQSLFPPQPVHDGTPAQDPFGDEERVKSEDGGSVAGVSQEESVTTDTQRNPNSLLGSRVSGSPTPTSGLPFVYPSQGCRMHQSARVPLPSPGEPLRLQPTTATVNAKYQIQQKVGEGTYGEVYRGFNKATKKEVALKRIKALEGLDGFPLTSVREVIALKFLRQSLSQNEKDHFVMLCDIVLSDDYQSVYLVFDFVEHSLAGLALRMRELRLEESDIATLFLRILRGVKILHERGIMHRDLKLDNILVDRRARVQLCDFGLSVPLGSKRQCLTPSLINLLYRPPEMLLGSLSYSTAVDVWSVGCMLAQMFLREPPFLVRDKDRAGSELGQLEAITNTLGPFTELSREMWGVADRRFKIKTLEMMRCIPSPNPPPSTNGDKLFSTWMKKHMKAERAPLSNDLYEVLDAVLQVNPSRRPTVDALLQFPFFTKAAHFEGRSVGSLVNRLRTLPSSHLLSVKQEIHEARMRHQQRHAAPQ